jgi:hypothetical protein
MKRLKSFIISFYFSGMFGQFIYLNWFHSILKHMDAAHNVGRSIWWMIGGVDPTPIAVWIFAISFGYYSAFSDKIEMKEEQSRIEKKKLTQENESDKQA